ncbi:MAG: ornithine cyclodeaminase family protein, partial [Candidatus Brocadiia bacterium]|nr:ornithine cyclodeaminase family protein [Candidatus Brocadiia bacterium]
MGPRETLLATKHEIEVVFGIRDAVECVENAFRLYGEDQVQMPPKVYLTFEKGDLRSMPAYLPTLGIAGVKNVNVHPQNAGIPTVMATITLVDPEDGFPLAVMDATYLTGLRTGAAGGVAAKHLARPDSEVAGFIGTGAQAHTQAAALAAVLPSVRRAVAFDMRREAAERFCGWCRQELGLEAEVGASVEEVTRECDVLTTTTPSRGAIVMDDWVRGGTHVNAIGADAAGKQELDPAILKRAVVVIDNWEQASHSGEVNVAMKEGLISRADIHGDIGEVVIGRKPGRERPDQVTVFDTTGLAIQDICCAGEVYRRLSSDPGAGGARR